MNEENPDVLFNLRNWNTEKIQQFVQTMFNGNINHKNDNGYTLLHCAAEHSGNAHLAEIFISMGADLNIKNNDGYTPLHLVAGNSIIDVLDVLVSNGADINAVDDKYNYTPLNLAVICKILEAVKHLASKGADLNTGNDCGYTPLHNAVIGGFMEIAEYLVSKGADVNVKSNDRGKHKTMTPLDIAKETSNKEMIQYLSGVSWSANTLNKGFIDILKKIVDKHGKGPLLDADKCGAFLADYAKRDYKEERRLLLMAVEAGVSREMIVPSDNRINCMKQQRRKLQEELKLDPAESLYAVDVMAQILWGCTFQID